MKKFIKNLLVGVISFLPMEKINAEVSGFSNTELEQQQLVAKNQMDEFLDLVAETEEGSSVQLQKSNTVNTTSKLTSSNITSDTPIKNGMPHSESGWLSYIASFLLGGVLTGTVLGVVKTEGAKNKRLNFFSFSDPIRDMLEEIAENQEKKSKA